MKKTLAVLLSLCMLLLCACTAQTNGPTPLPSDPSALPNDDNTRTSLRMFMADGHLYFDTGLISENTPRCGTMDGDLTKAAGDFEVPQNEGECNFDGAEGYQIATSITKEVLIKDEGWCIFKKVDVAPEAFKTMPYCMRLVGRLPSAAIDTDLCILTESLSVTVWDIMSPLFSSNFPVEVKYKTYTLSDNTAPDKWGLTLTAENVTQKGCTLRFTQLGGTLEGNLQTGPAYHIEKLSDDGKWEAVEPKQVLVWNHVAYLIPENEIYETQVDWTYGYGLLPPGSYRIAKEVADFKTGHEYKPETYYAYFDLTKAMCTEREPKKE